MSIMHPQRPDSPSKQDCATVCSQAVPSFLGPCLSPEARPASKPWHTFRTNRYFFHRLLPAITLKAPAATHLPRPFCCSCPGRSSPLSSSPSSVRSTYLPILISTCVPPETHKPFVTNILQRPTLTRSPSTRLYLVALPAFPLNNPTRTWPATQKRSRTSARRADVTRQDSKTRWPDPPRILPRPRNPVDFCPHTRSNNNIDKR